MQATNEVNSELVIQRSAGAALYFPTLPQLSPGENGIHERAKAASQRYLESEAKLVEILREVDATRLYKKLGHTSLFNYVVSALKLTEPVAYGLISVMRKTRDIAELKKAIAEHEVSVSKIRRLVSIMDSANARELIDFAKTHTNREIEREVSRRNPKDPGPEKERFVTGDLVKVEIYLPVAVRDELKRAQELESQRTQKAVSLADALACALNTHLDKCDPVRRAERAALRKEKKESGVQAEKSADAEVVSKSKSVALCEEKTREAEIFIPGTVGKPDTRSLDDKKSRRDSGSARRVSLTAEQSHAVHRRDGHRCCYVGSDGRRCENERWIEIHHRRPVSLGGSNEPQNLISACAAHHDLLHQMDFFEASQLNH